MAQKKREKYISKGKHSNVASGTLTAMRRAVGGADRLLNTKRAWKAGKNPWLTISNPNKSETNRLFIRVRSNEHWGDPKKAKYVVPSLKVAGDAKEAA